MRSHNCFDHLTYRQYESVEPHGEVCLDEWWECTVCGERWTEAELEVETDAAEDWD